MNKGFLSKALQSMDFKCGYILYVYKDLKLNVIKCRYVKG